MRTKLIVFDLDGTLVDCREMHYISLNQALINNGQDPINKEDHLNKFDGLNTNAKLDLLGITEPKLRKEIYEDKQLETWFSIDNLKPDFELWKTLWTLAGHDIKLCVASNSIRETVVKILEQLKIIQWFDFYLSNEDVFRPKPKTDMYHMAMCRGKASVNQTLIIEDSDIGIQGATETGAKVLRVKDSSEVTYENIIAHCNIN